MLILRRCCVQFSGPNAHKTILTLPTDERWKAVRKAVATAFSTSNMRANFPGDTRFSNPVSCLFLGTLRPQKCLNGIAKENSCRCYMRELIFIPTFLPAML